jgi:Recombination enhancement, RecA-dependent nuclease
MTKDEKNALNKVAELGCILCSTILGFEGTPSELHHIRRYGTKRSASPVIPLCPEHHRGNSGVHGLGAKGFERKWGVTQERLLEQVNQKLGKGNE